MPCGPSKRARSSRRSAISIPAMLEKTGADIGEAQGRKPEFEKEFERVLEDKEIDAVVIAMPDHWHARIAIMASRPARTSTAKSRLTQTIHEGHADRAAARKYNRVFQVGTQRRSGAHFQQRRRIRGLRASSARLRDQGVDLPGAAGPSAGLAEADPAPRASTMTCGSDRHPSGPSIPTASITTGASFGITATARSATRACMCWTWRCGRFRNCAASQLPAGPRIHHRRHLLARRRQRGTGHPNHDLPLSRTCC